MTLKLTHQQAEGLKRLFDIVINPEKPADVAERLVKALMFQVYKKLRARLESRIRDGYSLALTDTEAMAFYVYFQKRDLGTDWIYEQFMICQQLAELDKAYA